MNPTGEIITALAIPFAGTCTGAACVYFMRRQMPLYLEKALVGFAAGVMTAASVWSLLIPSIELSGDGAMAVVPAAVGFMLGVVFLLMLDKWTPHQHLHSSESEGPSSALSRSSRLAMAVTIHNIPEGIAMGIALTGTLMGDGVLGYSAAFALAVGLAVQNFPEGAIVSMPLHGMGHSRNKAFGMGVFSGAVEPVAALLTMAGASLILPWFPYLLAFGAGAMMFVVVEELLPMTAQGRHSNLGTIGFAAGFVLMMVLDVILG